MKVEAIQPINGERHAILDNNAIVRVSDFKTTVRVGYNVDITDDRWIVTGRNVDVDCPNGVCPAK